MGFLHGLDSQRADQTMTQTTLPSQNLDVNVGVKSLLAATLVVRGALLLRFISVVDLFGIIPLSAIAFSYKFKHQKMEINNFEHSITFPQPVDQVFFKPAELCFMSTYLVAYPYSLGRQLRHEAKSLQQQRSLSLTPPLALWSISKKLQAARPNKIPLHSHCRP